MCELCVCNLGHAFRFHDYTVVSQGTGGSVEDCAAVCDKLAGNRHGGAKCTGFHVWEPCVVRTARGWPAHFYCDRRKKGGEESGGR